MAFVFEFVEDGFEGGDDCFIFKVAEGLDKDLVCVVVVCNEEVLHTVERSHW